MTVEKINFEVLIESIVDLNKMVIENINDLRTRLTNIEIEIIKIKREISEHNETINTLFSFINLHVTHVLEITTNSMRILQATFSPHFAQELQTKKKLEKLENIYKLINDDSVRLIKLWSEYFETENENKLVLSGRINEVSKRWGENLTAFFNLYDELWRDFLKWRDNMEKDLHNP